MYCRLPPSTFYARAAIARNPDLACNRAKQYAHDLVKIKQVHRNADGRLRGTQGLASAFARD